MKNVYEFHLNPKSNLDLKTLGFEQKGDKWYRSDAVVERALTPYLWPNGVPRFAEYTATTNNKHIEIELERMFDIKSIVTY